MAQLAQGRMKKALPPTIRPLLAGSLNIQDTQPVVVALRVRSEAAITARISRGLRAGQNCRAAPHNKWQASCRDRAWAQRAATRTRSLILPAAAGTRHQQRRRLAPHRLLLPLPGLT